MSALNRSRMETMRFCLDRGGMGMRNLAILSADIRTTFAPVLY